MLALCDQKCCIISISMHTAKRLSRTWTVLLVVCEWPHHAQIAYGITLKNKKKKILQELDRGWHYSPSSSLLCTCRNGSSCPGCSGASSSSSSSSCLFVELLPILPLLNTSEVTLLYVKHLSRYPMSLSHWHAIRASWELSWSCWMTTE